MTGRSSQNLRNRSSTKPQSQFPNSPLQSPNNGTDGDDDAPSPRSEEIPTKKESASGWAVRTRWTLILLAIFIVLISIGHSALTLLVIACQVSMYREIVAIGFKWNKEKELPLFRTLNWYFYACVSAWVYSRTMRDIILETSTLGKLLYWPIHYNTFVFYSSLCIGKRIVLFFVNIWN
jgi:phosphatidate cytidylyltransferase